MNVSFRTLAAVGILIVAAAGCQKGKGPETAEKASKNAGQAASEKRQAKGGTGSATARHDGASSRVGASASGGRVSTLTVADDGRSFDLREGQVVTVALPCNRALGFSWVEVDPKGSVMVPDGKPTYVAKTGKGGTETWHFRAAHRGEQTVKLEYGREWQRNTPERAFRFTASVR